MKNRRQKYEDFRRLLVAARKRKGVTQAELAARIGKPQNFVSKCESGERRVDVVELALILQALGVSPSRFLSELAKKVS